MYCVTETSQEVGKCEAGDEQGTSLEEDNVPYKVAGYYHITYNSYYYFCLLYDDVTLYNTVIKIIFYYYCTGTSKSGWVLYLLKEVLTCVLLYACPERSTRGRLQKKTK